jgi:hypothetical protein
MQPLISRQHVRIATGSSDERGVLFFANGRLIAIIVCLSEPSHGSMTGRWFLEVRFGDLFSARAPETFSDIDTAEEWLIGHIKPLSSAAPNGD